MQPSNTLMASTWNTIRLEDKDNKTDKHTRSANTTEQRPKARFKTYTLKFDTQHWIKEMFS